MKFVVVIGTIMSGLGKGAVAASVGRLLKEGGAKVAMVKFDGYLNVDCGTMNPYRHGEVFVLKDGREVDMDFGTYERFLNEDMTKESSITGGMLFKEIIEKEREGKFLGEDVQFVPHLINHIKSRVKDVGKKKGADIVVVEVGGTAGDLENGYFIEAMRQLANEEQVVFIQLTYAPQNVTGELKTKPTQHANRILLGMGIKPSIVIVRSRVPLGKAERRKIAMFCNVKETNVFDDTDVDTVYELLLLLEKQNLYSAICRELGCEEGNVKLTEWREKVEKIKKPKKTVSVAVVGKYTSVKDAYVSVKEALIHAGAENNTRVDIKWVEAEELEENLSPLYDVDGIIVPGGFGKRGVEGKINAIRYAREKKVPYLGLCLGLQLMAVEWARNINKMEGANSTEFDPQTKFPVVKLLDEQRYVEKLGGTMRLGDYECRLKEGTLAYKAYGKERVYERHRHRYEVNPELMKELEKTGLIVSGRFKDEIVEIIEWPDSFGVATQAHIELSSKLESPAPLFVKFVEAAISRKEA